MLLMSQTVLCTNDIVLGTKNTLHDYCWVRTLVQSVLATEMQLMHHVATSEFCPQTPRLGLSIHFHR